MTILSLHDRVRGCILAGAIGDAMGSSFEGNAVSNENSDQTPWAISDDTQLTLATCEAILQECAISPEAIASCFARWYQQRRITGIGASTLKALRELEAGQHWALAGAKGERAAGNGAAMRIAPLAFLLNPNTPEDRRTLRDICRITHHHEEAYLGGLAVVSAIYGIVFMGLSLDELFSHVISSLPDSCMRDHMQEIAKLPASLEIRDVAQQFGCSGYVVESVPLALYAARQISKISLEKMFRNVITAGGDTDTIASIAGQIAGAGVGVSSIPLQFLATLRDKELILTTADDFADFVDNLPKSQ